jgi:hypothetical protein
MSRALVKAEPVALPVVIKETCSVVGQLTKALGVPRTVLASDDEIEHVWADPPRLLARIPREQIKIINKKFDEEDLLDLKDAELLELCLSLNLITEDGHFFLDQSRDVRNNFSAAHPPMGGLDGLQKSADTPLRRAVVSAV